MRPTFLILAAGGCFALGFSLGMPEAAPVDSRRREVLQRASAAGEPDHLSQRGAAEPVHPPSAPEPLDLDGLLHLALGEGPIAREAAMIQALQPLGKERWAALFAQLAADSAGDNSMGFLPPGDNSRTVLRRALLRLWAAAAPEEALRAMTTPPHLGPETLDDAEADIMVLNLARRGFDHTARVLRMMPESAMPGAWQSLAEWCLAHDPARVTAALREWAGTTTGLSISPLRRPLMESWIAIDRAAAQQWLDSIASLRRYGLARTAFFEALARHSVAGAKEWIETIPDETVRKDMRQSLIRDFVKTAPPAEAADYLRQNSVGDSDLWSDLARRWAQSDPDAALAWAASSCPNAEMRSSALSACAAEMARGATTWAEAEDLAARMPDAETRDDCLERAIRHLRPAEALAHLKNATGLSRSVAIRRALTGDPPLPLEQILPFLPEYGATGDSNTDTITARLLEERSPQAALEWAASLPGEWAGRNLRTAWYLWTRNDPAAAADAAMQIPESDSRQEAIKIVTLEWADDDAVAATGWLAGLPPGTEKDTAAASMVPVIAPVDQSGALVWAAAISDEKLRMEALQSVKSLSPFTTADRWRANVEAAPLSDEEKATLLSR